MAVYLVCYIISFILTIAKRNAGNIVSENPIISSLI